MSVNGAETNAGFANNGLGDRLQQTVDGATMTYTLDLNTGLTQVLTESAPQGYGDTTYLYGLARLSQESDGYSEYYLGDALGSVRQLTEGSGALTYAATYTPYGEVLSSAGEGESVWGYTGEAADVYIKLIYLRSRYYSSLTGNFISRDSWQGDYIRPLSLNRWSYTEGNPTNFTDPEGYGNLQSKGWEKPCVLNDDEQFCILNNGAFIDESHFGRGDPGHKVQTDFWKRLEDVSGNGQQEILITSSTFYLFYRGIYTVDIPKSAEARLPGIAVGIWLDYQQKFERWQYEQFPIYISGGDFCPIVRVSSFGAHSAFETADIPSTYMGLVAAISEMSYKDIVDELGGGHSSSSAPPGHKLTNIISEAEFARCVTSGCTTGGPRNSTIFQKAQDESGSYYLLPYPDTIYIPPDPNWHAYFIQYRYDVILPWERD